MTPTWTDILIQIVQIIVYALVAGAIPFVIKWAKTKTDNEILETLIDTAGKIVSDSVTMINQTFVDNLKAEGEFDAESQREAFQKCSENILSMMNDETKQAVIKLYGSLEVYISTMIEKYVKSEKMWEL